MRRPRFTVPRLVVAIAAVAVLIVVLTERRHGKPPVLSPDGSMSLITRIEESRQDPGAFLCVVFAIRDRSGRILHEENTGASDRMRWDLSWDSNERIRLKSSDIGTYHWQRQRDASWKEEITPGQ